MKTFNKILSSLFALSLFLGFTACNDEVKYTSADLLTNAQVYFPSTLPSKVNLSQDLSVKSYDVVLYRIDKAAALTVNISAVNDDPGIFTIPTSVSFTAGSEMTKLTITYDPVALGYDTYKSITLTVSDGSLTTPYGVSSYTFTAGIPSAWKSLGLATYTDDFMTTFWGVSLVPYQVEIQENMVTPGVFRLVNPYGEAYPYNDPGDWDDSKDYYFEINASDPNGVYIPHWQETGCDWGYGPIKMSSIAGLRLFQGNTLESQKEAGNCGTYADGIITFPKSTLLISLPNYQTGGFYTANGNGWFQVIMPGVVIADYSAKIEYAGRYADSKENLFAVANVTLGPDVEYAHVALVAGPMTQAALDGVIDGSIESVKITSGGSVQIPCSAVGRYTFIVVTYANDEAQDFNYTSFNFTTGGGSTLYPIEDFYGEYIMSGLDYWDDTEVSMPVTIEPGDAPNTLVISGIDFAESVIATFPVKGYMSIAPQELSDKFTYKGVTYDLSFGTVLEDGDVSDEIADAMVFTRLESGDLVLTTDSYAIGYMIFFDLGGLDSYYDISFTPASSAKAAALKASYVKKTSTPFAPKSMSKNRKSQVKSSETFKIQKKAFNKKSLNQQIAPATF